MKSTNRNKPEFIQILNQVQDDPLKRLSLLIRLSIRDGLWVIGLFVQGTVPMLSSRNFRRKYPGSVAEANSPQLK
jgi:hypothetical protein